MSSETRWKRTGLDQLRGDALWEYWGANLSPKSRAELFQMRDSMRLQEQKRQERLAAKQNQPQDQAANHELPTSISPSEPSATQAGDTKEEEMTDEPTGTIPLSGFGVLSGKRVVGLIGGRPASGEQLMLYLDDGTSVSITARGDRLHGERYKPAVDFVQALATVPSATLCLAVSPTSPPGMPSRGDTKKVFPLWLLPRSLWARIAIGVAGGLLFVFLVWQGSWRYYSQNGFQWRVNKITGTLQGLKYDGGWVNMK